MRTLIIAAFTTVLLAGCSEHDKTLTPSQRTFAEQIRTAPPGSIFELRNITQAELGFLIVCKTPAYNGRVSVARVGIEGHACGSAIGDYGLQPEEWVGNGASERVTRIVKPTDSNYRDTIVQHVLAMASPPYP